MGKIAILAGGDSALLPKDHDVYVGVDGGCLKLLEQGLPLDIAVGDFDSVSETDLRQIQTQAKQVIQSIPEKNDTDLELALKAAFEAIQRLVSPFMVPLAVVWITSCPISFCRPIQT